MLKPVDKKKNPGLAKLPEKVRNKMGYAKKGKMMKAKSGNMAKIDKVVKGLNKASKLHQSQAKTLKTIKANVGMAAKKVREDQMMKASMGKSVRGYGAARTSGMGLQDESLPPGKSLDYYKDLM